MTNAKSFVHLHILLFQGRGLNQIVKKVVLLIFGYRRREFKKKKRMKIQIKECNSYDYKMVK